MIKLNFLPRRQNILIHIKIKNFKNKSESKNYLEATKLFIDKILDTDPLSIFIPAFNFDFISKGTFDYKNSVSQVGRFSEELRKFKYNKRTLDPVFCFIDLLNSYPRNKWTLNAFSNDSYFKAFLDHDFIIINYDLDEFKSSLIHFIEKNQSVPYRYNKEFKGEVIFENKKIDLSYNYFVRDLNKQSIYNGNKIKNLLVENNCFNHNLFYDLPFNWFRANDLYNHLSNKVMMDKNYCVNNID